MIVKNGFFRNAAYSIKVCKYHTLTVTDNANGMASKKTAYLLQPSIKQWLKMTTFVLSDWYYTQTYSRKPSAQAIVWSSLFACNCAARSRTIDVAFS